MASTSPAPSLSRRQRLTVILAAFAGLLFDGIELGLMPIASLSVTRDLLGPSYTSTLGGDWFAWLTASLMLGAAIGGIALGRLGDRIGRARALGVSILFYSAFSGLGALADTLGQLTVLRFLVGLGVGGVWPNAVALVAESFPDASRPALAGILGAAINAGILLLSQVARWWPITPQSWRWLFGWCAAPGALGLLVLAALPESPRWASRRRDESDEPAPSLFRPPLLRFTVTGILLGGIPLVGAWAASKWVIPWADAVGGSVRPDYKAAVQGWWALGATLGSLLGSQVAAFLGRRRSYSLISLGATLLTCGMFAFGRPLAPGFLGLVFLQGLVATLYFGWLPLYLPELFPTRVRAAGSGIAYNGGRFATAVGVLGAGALVAPFGGDYARVGAAAGLVYLLGLIAIRWAPETADRALED